MGSVVDRTIDGLADAIGEAHPVVGVVIVLAIVFLVALSLESHFPGAVSAAFGFVLLIIVFMLLYYCIKERARF